MQLSEFYEGIGGSYEDVLLRLQSDRLIVRFLSKFPADGSYAELCVCFDAGMLYEAFCKAHTLKGICMNLGFGDMSATICEITELLRPADETVDCARVRTLMEALKEQYAKVLDGIRQIGS